MKKKKIYIISFYSLTVFNALHLRIFTQHLKDKFDFIYVEPTLTEKHVMKYLPKWITVESTIFANSKDYFNNPKIKTWRDFYNEIKIDKIETKGNYLITMAGMINANYEFKTTEKLNKIIDTSRGFKFISERSMLSRVVYLIKFANETKMPIHHFVGDPLEIDYGKLDLLDQKCFRYFGYESEDFNLINHNFYRSYLNSLNEVDLPKKRTYLVSYTANSPKRKHFHTHYYPPLKKLNDSLLYINDKYLEIKQYVPKEEYFDKLKTSNFTFIFPAYEDKSFSYRRFLEALRFGCVPIVFEECKYGFNQFLESYGYILEDLDFVIVSTKDNIEDKFNKENYLEMFWKLREMFLFPKLKMGFKK